jgi:hypothetical protein
MISGRTDSQNGHAIFGAPLPHKTRPSIRRITQAVTRTMASKTSTSTAVIRSVKTPIAGIAAAITSETTSRATG